MMPKVHSGFVDFANRPEIQTIITALADAQVNLDALLAQVFQN